MTILGRRNTNGRLRLFDDTLPSALALLSIPLLSLSFSFFFNNHLVSAYSATLTANTNVTVNAKPNSDGSTGTKINAEEIGVATNCRAGYNLTITGPSDRNLYKDGNSANNTSGQYFTPVDGTSTLANTTNSWGYSLASNASSSTVFTPLPNTDTYIRTTTQTASETDINDNIPIYYGVSVTNSISPGQYTMSNNNTIVYQLTVDTTCRGYIVAFNANGGTGTMENQDINIGDATKLTKNSFTAPAKGQSYQDADGITISADPDKLWTFWGWNTKADGTGDWYKNIEQVTDIADDGEILTLYAQWKQATLADIDGGQDIEIDPDECIIFKPGDRLPEGCKTIDHNTMQDMSAEICYNSPITTANDVVGATLTDNRDGTVRSYDVSKLADGNCWMTTNLALGTTSAITLTSDDTDLSDGTTFTLPAGDTTSYTATTNLAKVRLTNTSGATTNGAYYSWAAAVANTSSISTSPTTSICPRNWDLPTNAQYTNLSSKSAYSSSNLTTNAPSSFLISSAGFTNGATWYQTNYGFYWTSTSSSTAAAYGARVTSSALTTSATASTTYGGNKYYRKNIRCVAGVGTANITYHSNNTASTTSTQSVNVGTGTLAASSLFTAESHKQFKEWNTAADGTGTSYAAGTSVSSAGLYPGQSLELYAIWNDTWTITFVNTATSATQTKDIVQGQSGTVAPTSSWTRTNYKLAGWDTVTNDGSTGTVVYTNGQSITPTDDMTVYTVWTPTYTIQYDGNNADAGVMTNVKHTNVGSSDSFDLYASNYSRSGYGFIGWSFTQLDPDAANFATNLASAISNNEIYGPNEQITAPALTTPGETKTLYAVWVPAETNVTLQTFDPADSTYINMSNGSVLALKDERDDDVYAVAKLADGNWWMIENLRLDNSNSDNSTGSLAEGYDSSFIGLADPETTNFANRTTANSLYSTYGSTTATISGSNQGYRFPRFNYANTNARSTNPSATDNRATATSAHGTSLDAATYSYGNYYTWAAAAADTTYYTTDNTNVETSICPKGWHLPTGNSGGEFSSLDSAMGGTGGYQSTTEASLRWRKYPNNFLYSGYFSSSSPNYRGRSDYYWSSTTNGISSYSLYLDSSGVYPGTATVINNCGRSIRCVAGS